MEMGTLCDAMGKVGEHKLGISIDVYLRSSTDPVHPGCPLLGSMKRPYHTAASPRPQCATVAKMDPIPANLAYLEVPVVRVRPSRTPGQTRTVKRFRTTWNITSPFCILFVGASWTGAPA